MRKRTWNYTVQCRVNNLYEEKIHKEYVNFMNEYCSLQHMKMSAVRQVNLISYSISLFDYVPSVIFNTSVCDESGLSFHDIFKNGPRVQPDVFNTR